MNKQKHFSYSFNGWKGKKCVYCGKPATRQIADASVYGLFYPVCDECFNELFPKKKKID